MSDRYVCSDWHRLWLQNTDLQLSIFDRSLCLIFHSIQSAKLSILIWYRIQIFNFPYLTDLYIWQFMFWAFNTVYKAFRIQIFSLQYLTDLYVRQSTFWHSIQCTKLSILIWLKPVDPISYLRCLGQVEHGVTSRKDNVIGNWLSWLSWLSWKGWTWSNLGKT